MTVVRNTSNFRGTGAAAALSGGYDPALMKSVAQLSFSKFTAQQQLNAKARDPTAVNGHSATASPNTKPNKPSHANTNTNQPPNTDFTHVLHNEDAPLPAAPATIAPPPQPQPQQSQGRASAPKAGASSNPEFNIISTLNSKEEKSWKAEHSMCCDSALLCFALMIHSVVLTLRAAVYGVVCRGDEHQPTRLCASVERETGSIVQT